MYPHLAPWIEMPLASWSLTQCLTWPDPCCLLMSWVQIRFHNLWKCAPAWEPVISMIWPCGFDERDWIPTEEALYFLLIFKRARWIIGIMQISTHHIGNWNCSLTDLQTGSKTCRSFPKSRVESYLSASISLPPHFPVSSSPPSLSLFVCLPHTHTPPSLPVSSPFLPRGQYLIVTPLHLHPPRMTPASSRPVLTFSDSQFLEDICQVTNSQGRDTHPQTSLPLPSFLPDFFCFCFFLNVRTPLATSL